MRYVEYGGVVVFLLVSLLTIVMVVPNGATSVAGVFWQDWKSTPFGPLGPSDREVLIKVREANLWEIPTGQQAIERARSERVREVGVMLSEDHKLLDERVRDVAEQLDVVLPSMPTREQQRWMEEMSRLSGDEYDKVAVNRLRYAHGQVIQLLAEVRAGTRNELIRSFVQHTMLVVLRHLTHLESTGLVDYEDLPEPLPPERRPGV
nr:DUF4142 domain-containing protein [Nocardiopsis mwathae]